MIPCRMGGYRMELYEIDCTPLTDEARLRRSLPFLDIPRRQTVSRMPAGLPRAQKAAAGLLLTHLFGSHGQPPVIAHGAHGKPYLPNGQAHFSLSHTGHQVFCAVADTPVGLDAQTADCCRPRVAERCFTPREQAWLAQDPDGRFSRLWALKEAYLKYTGFGLVLPMSSFTVPLPADGYDPNTDCHWREMTAHSVRLALCRREPIPEVKVRSLDIPTLLRALEEKS